MRNAHTSRRRVEAAFGGLDLDFDVAQDAVPNDSFDLDLVAFELGNDALMEAVEHELSAAALAALYDGHARDSLPHLDLFDEFEAA